MMKLMKRLLSIILCAAMLASLGIFASASESSSEVVPAGYTPIYSRAQLEAVGKDLGGKYILMCDIDLGGKDAPWTPIGTNGRGFTGVFDGNSHVIRGLYISSTYSDYQGLFGLNCGIIRSLTCQGEVSGDEYIGGIAGASVSKTSSSVLIENCRNEVTVTGRGNYVGGITGLSQATTESGSVSITLSGCVNAGTVTGGAKYTGGVCGGSIAYVSSSSVKKASASANVKDCHNTGVVNGKSVVGGVVGTHQAYTVKSNTSASAQAYVTKCTNSRMVNSSSDACGGIVAVNDATTYANATARVNACANSGTITGGGVDAGGIVSRSMSETSTTKAVAKAEVYDCRNIGSVTAKGNGKQSYAGGIVAYDCANSKYGTSTANISTCLSAGKVSALGDGAYGGAIVGYKYIGANEKYDSGLEKVSKADVKKCYYLAGSAGKGIAYGADTTVALDEAKCKQQANFEGFDFTYSWRMDKDRPNLRGLTSVNAYSTICGNLKIEGDPLPGNLLTLDLSDMTPLGIEYTIEWYRSGEKLEESGIGHFTVPEDMGKDIWAVVRPKGKVRGTLKSEVCHARYDELTEKPVLAGDLYYNGNVTAVFADETTTATYKWYVGGKFVAEGDSYTPTRDDVGCELKCVATGYDHFWGSIESEGQVIARSPLKGSIDYDYETLKYGTPVPLDMSNVEGREDFTYIVEWTRDDGDVRTGEALETTEEDIGHTFRAKLIVDQSFLYTGTLECPGKIRISDWNNPYNDVVYGKWYNEAVGFVTEMGLFNGTTKRTFEPELEVTRGMFVTVLSRLARAEVDDGATAKFDDVKKGKWYTGAVIWATENGITNGTSATKFEPDASITREQLCAMMVRYASFAGDELKPQTVEPDFADESSISKYARESVRTMHFCGIVGGRGGNKFVPLGTATRAEVATVLQRYVKFVDGSEPKPEE